MNVRANARPHHEAWVGRSGLPSERLLRMQATERVAKRGDLFAPVATAKQKLPALA